MKLEGKASNHLALSSTCLSIRSLNPTLSNNQSPSMHHVCPWSCNQGGNSQAKHELSCISRSEDEILSLRVGASKSHICPIVKAKVGSSGTEA
eukprot:2369070-Amphidinium_carterae.1